jgi:hypothetical protein
MIPLVCGIVFMVFYSKNILSGFVDDMRVLLSTYDDKR